MDHQAGPIPGSPALTSANIRLQDWSAGPFVSAPSSQPELRPRRTFSANLSPNQTDLLLQEEKAMAPHSSTLAWRIPWVEEPGALQSMGSLRVGHD